MNDPHEKLLQEWTASDRHHATCLIRDGIIDPARWGQAPRKVLFILREAYGDPAATEGWDLRTVIREEWAGPKYKIWWTISYWAYVLQCASLHLLSPFPVDATAIESARQALLSCAVINVKKSGGKSSSNLEDLTSYANSDGAFIRRQVDLIEPQIMVCGNVWSRIQGLWPDARQDYDAVWKADGRTVIDFWHPANRFPNQLNYYAFAALLQNSGTLGHCPARAPAIMDVQPTAATGRG